TGRQCRQGCRVQERQAAAVRLLRRSDHEGDAGQGEPAGRERAAAGEAGLVRRPGLDPGSTFLAGWKRWIPAFAGMTMGRLMRSFLSAGAGVFLPSHAVQSPPRPPPEPPRAPPKLVVVISMDQFSADLWDQYRPQFTGGLARLASGTVFHNGYQSHAATETCPGHSTILTGDHPAHTGIIANTWIDQSVQRSDVSIYCAEDETAAGSSSAVYTVSPNHLLV